MFICSRNMKKFDFSIIKNLRGKWGITAEELANRANLTRATVAKMESGCGNPTIDTIEALSAVFHLTSSELIRLAEVARCEEATAQPFGKQPGLDCVHVWFPDFEVYHVKGKAGTRKESDPQRHENTAEVCMTLSGRIRLTVGGKSYELGPGMAVRFKALHDHHFDVMEDAEFLLIHHNMG